MHEPLDPPTADRVRAEGSAPCDCVCGEPADAADPEAAPVDRTTTSLQVWWENNGEPERA